MTGQVRSARPGDEGAIVGLVVELADYEKARDAVLLTPDTLHEALFGADPSIGCEVVDLDGTIVGMALWFRSYSTWEGRPGLYLEDLYVQPDHRGAGYGRALLVTLARVAHSRGWARVEWAVLDWNTPAQGFYRALGAVAMDEWTVNRLTGPALAALAGDPVDPPDRF